MGCLPPITSSVPCDLAEPPSAVWDFRTSTAGQGRNPRQSHLSLRPRERCPGGLTRNGRAGVGAGQRVLEVLFLLLCDDRLQANAFLEYIIESWGDRRNKCY